MSEKKLRCGHCGKVDDGVPENIVYGEEDSGWCWRCYRCHMPQLNLGGKTYEDMFSDPPRDLSEVPIDWSPVLGSTEGIKAVISLEGGESMTGIYSSVKDQGVRKVLRKLKKIPAGRARVRVRDFLYTERDKGNDLWARDRAGV